MWDTTGKSKNDKITKKPSPNWGKRGWWCGIQPGKLEEKSDRKSWGNMLNNTKIYFVRYNQENWKKSQIEKVEEACRIIPKSILWDTIMTKK